MYFYFQEASDSTWIAVPADSRAAVIEKNQPKYVTVLNVSQALDEDDPDTTKEMWRDLKYQGPFYADWDCEDLMDGADSVRRFLKNLEEKYQVNPRCVSIYASGGRGYHIEVPFATMSQIKRDHVKHLPAIYREMASSLYTNDLDLAVYSAKRGRMWRTPNVEREQKGRYKVPITFGQLNNMTEEMYLELTSAPQPEPDLEIAEFSEPLAALFMKCKERVDSKMRELASKKKDDDVIARMKGQYPATAIQMMNGENLNPDVGLNKIALQLGILSVALGKSLEDHLEACEGLIKTYRGDHSTAGAVRRELKRMYRYADNNVCYSYSAAALAACAKNREKTQDLNAEDRFLESEDNDSGDLSDLSAGILLGQNGIFQRTKEGKPKRMSNWAFSGDSVCEMTDPVTLKPKGFVFDSKTDGKITGQAMVRTEVFQSADRMRAFMSDRNALAPSLDTLKTGGIGALIMNSARANTRVMALEKEGINIIEIPNYKPEVVWASSYGCVGSSLQHQYRLDASNGSEDGTYQCDIHMAPRIQDQDPATVKAVIDAILNLNNNARTMAFLIGWLSSSWLKPHIVKWSSQFPILQCYGESGAGKSQACLALMPLFYFRSVPKVLNASVGTAFGRRTMYSGTTSIPLLVDEFKPDKMHPDVVREFLSTIHEMYSPKFQAPRGGGTGSNGRWNDVGFDIKTAPLFFTTEMMQTETAIMERTISVHFSKVNLQGTQEHMSTLLENKEIMASIGALMLRATLNAPMDKLKERWDDCKNRTKPLRKNGNDRIVHNITVALYGLEFLETVLKHTFKETFSENGWDRRFEQMRAAILDDSDAFKIRAVPEIVKILQFMMAVSEYEEDLELTPRMGIEYDYPGGADCSDLDINVDAFYMKLRVVSQRRSGVVRFPDVESFHQALLASSLFKEEPAGSALQETSGVRARVVRLCGERLASFNLGAFKVQEGRTKR